MLTKCSFFVIVFFFVVSLLYEHWLCARTIYVSVPSTTGNVSPLYFQAASFFVVIFQILSWHPWPLPLTQVTHRRPKLQSHQSSRLPGMYWTQHNSMLYLTKSWKLVRTNYEICLTQSGRVGTTTNHCPLFPPRPTNQKQCQLARRGFLLLVSVPARLQ